MPYEGSPLQQAARIITRINPEIGVDLIVRSADQIRERLACTTALCVRSWSVERSLMKPTTLEWIDKAEGDFDIVTLGSRTCCDASVSRLELRHS